MAKEQREVDNRWTYTIHQQNQDACYLQYLGNDAGFLYLLDVYSDTAIIHMIPEDSVAEMHFAVIESSQ